MITCKDCRHWERIAESCRGECSSESFIDLYSDSDDEIESVPKDGLGHGGYETFDIWITGEDFGCIHGINKEEKHG